MTVLHFQSTSLNQHTWVSTIKCFVRAIDPSPLPFIIANGSRYSETSECKLQAAGGEQSKPPAACTCHCICYNGLYKIASG